MTANTDQRAFWSDTVGDIWVTHSQAVDAIFAPVLDSVLAHANIHQGARVLDIGCGAGGSTFAVAALVDAHGAVDGIDISAPLLAAARADSRMAPNVHFILADAQTQAFDPDAYDLVLSRFGMMFFDDPVTAFTNMAGSLASGGKMVFATWGSIAQNPFFTLPAALSKAHFGPMPKTDPDAPGPFSMRDTDKVLGILAAAGLEQGAAEVAQMALTPHGTAQDLAALMCEIGPAKSAMAAYNADGPARTAFVAKLAAELKTYETPAGLRVPAEINIFTARKP